MECSGNEAVAGIGSYHDSPVGTLQEEQCAQSTSSTHSHEATTNLPLAIVEVDNFEVAASGSENDEEDIEDLMGGSAPSKRKTRGVTRLTTVMPSKGQKWTCLVDKNNKPIGDYGSKLSQALGIFARMEPYFPVHNEWSQECEVSFSMIFQKIISAYDFVDKNGNHVDAAWIRHYCRETVKDRVKEFRAWLKKRYWTRHIENNEVPNESPDNRVSQECWDALKKDWGNEAKISEASRNKKNRAHGRVVHSRGSTSIATFMHSLEQEMGDNYDKMEAYCTYFKKNGAYGNNYVEEKCEEARVLYGELSQSSLGSISLPRVLDSVYGGHHGGYERGIGVGAPRRRPRHGDIHVHCQQTIQSLQSQLEGAQSQLENTKSQLEVTQNELRDTQNNLQNTLASHSEAQAQIEILRRTLDRFERFMNKQQQGHGKGRRS